jgi:hypothetical protein
MPPSKPETSLDALRRKLRGVTSIFRDPSATDNEKANAAGIKDRLEVQLKQAGEPSGDWSDFMFRLGRTAREIKQSTTRTEPSGDWTGHAFQLGKAVRKGLTKLRRP